MITSFASSLRTAAGAVVLCGLFSGLVGCGDMVASSKGPREHGQKLYEEKSYSDAAGAFRNAVRQDPSDYKAHYHLGQSYEQLGSFHQAIQSYRSALDTMKVTMKGREDENFRVLVIDSLARSLAKTDERTSQTAALENRPQSAENKHILAKTYQYLGDADAALGAYAQAARLDTKDFAIARDYGLYLEQLEMTDQAVPVLRRAYTLNGQDEQVIAALRRNGVVPGPSLKDKDKLAGPPLPKGPLPEVDMKKFGRGSGSASTSTEGAYTGPRD